MYYQHMTQSQILDIFQSQKALVHMTQSQILDIFQSQKALVHKTQSQILGTLQSRKVLYNSLLLPDVPQFSKICQKILNSREKNLKI